MWKQSRLSLVSCLWLKSESKHQVSSPELWAQMACRDMLWACLTVFWEMQKITKYHRWSRLKESMQNKDVNYNIVLQCNCFKKNKKHQRWCGAAREQPRLQASFEWKGNLRCVRRLWKKRMRIVAVSLHQRIVYGGWIMQTPNQHLQR